jgi:hypothetical protein
MRDFFDSASATIRRWFASARKWATRPVRHRVAHAVLAITNVVLGGVLLLEAQWIHAASVLIAAAAYHGLTRPGKGPDDGVA